MPLNERRTAYLPSGPPEAQLARRGANARRDERDGRRTAVVWSVFHSRETELQRPGPDARTPARPPGLAAYHVMAVEDIEARRGTTAHRGGARE
jgi:hypothetical protein